MKEAINNDRTKQTPLVFKCTCGSFISNEYNPGMMLPSHGIYPSASDVCPSCGNKVIRGRIYCPLINSKEHKKWYGK